MEAGIMITSFAVGGILVFPVLWEALKEKLPALLTVGGILLVFGLLLPLAPHGLLEDIAGVPGNAAQATLDSIAKFNSEYYNAMH